jgi:VWFA-related protein
MIRTIRLHLAPAAAVAGAFIALISLSAAPGATSGQAANPRQREVYVGVVDEAGAPVTNLAASDFSVREDGVFREVLRLEPATDPMHIALIVDNSAAMRLATNDVRRGLKTFVETINAHDPIAIVTIADRPTMLLSYTLDRARIQKAVDQIMPVGGSGTTLLDAIVDTAHGIEKQGAVRAAMVVVTGEGPEFSNVQYDTVVDAIRHSGAALAAVVVTRMSNNNNANNNTDDDAGRNRGLTLDRGSAASGGRYRTLLSSLGLAGELKSLASELNNQYRVVYARPESLVPPEKIEVKVKRPGLTARATPAKIRTGA